VGRTVEPRKIRSGAGRTGPFHPEPKHTPERDQRLHAKKSLTVRTHGLNIARAAKVGCVSVPGGIR
jgi:hypothetical protein